MRTLILWLAVFTTVIVAPIGIGRGQPAQSNKFAVVPFLGGTLIPIPAADAGLKRATVWLPGYKEQQTITYRDTFEGMYVIEGDVLVDPTWTPARKYERATLEVSEGIGSTAQPLSSIETGHLWPMGIIPYAISDEFSSSVCRQIEDYVRELDSESDLTFVPRVDDADYIDFRAVDEGCFTSTGWHGGRHRIFLGRGCIDRRVVKHETLHAAGFHHEHIREDRDDFAQVLWNNIQEDNRHNFEKRTGETFNQTDYDYGSVMHYASTAFGKVDASGNTLQTLRPTQPGVAASRLGGPNVSVKDIDGIKRGYVAVIPNDPLLRDGVPPSIIETTYDRCRQTAFTVGIRNVGLGDTVGTIIPLQNNHFSWRCAGVVEWTTCRRGVTHVRVSRDSGGRIQWDCMTKAPNPGARFLGIEVDRCGGSTLQVDTTTGRRSIPDKTPTFVEVSHPQIAWHCGNSDDRAVLPEGTGLVRVSWDRENDRRIEWQSYTRGVTTACR